MTVQPVAEVDAYTRVLQAAKTILVTSARALGLSVI